MRLCLCMGVLFSTPSIGDDLSKIDFMRIYTCRDTTRGEYVRFVESLASTFIGDSDCSIPILFA